MSYDPYRRAKSGEERCRSWASRWPQRPPTRCEYRVHPGHAHASLDGSVQWLDRDAPTPEEDEMSTTRDDRIVEVTYPVRIRMRLGDIEGTHALREIRYGLERLVLDAASPDPDVDRDEADHRLAVYTPEDDGTGSFGVTVKDPIVDLRSYLYQAQIELRDAEVSP